MRPSTSGGNDGRTDRQASGASHAGVACRLRSSSAPAASQPQYWPVQGGGEPADELMLPTIDGWIEQW